MASKRDTASATLSPAVLSRRQTRTEIELSSSRPRRPSVLHRRMAICTCCRLAFTCKALILSAPPDPICNFSNMLKAHAGSAAWAPNLPEINHKHRPHGSARDAGPVDTCATYERAGMQGIPARTPIRTLAQTKTLLHIDLQKHAQMLAHTATRRYTHTHTRWHASNACTSTARPHPA